MVAPLGAHGQSRDADGQRGGAKRNLRFQDIAGAPEESQNAKRRNTDRSPRKEQPLGRQRIKQNHASAAIRQHIEQRMSNGATRPQHGEPCRRAPRMPASNDGGENSIEKDEEQRRVKK